MALTKHMTDRKATPKRIESREDRLFREEREFRADKLVEKWSRVKEIGRGIPDLPVQTARNLAILLENQASRMKRMTEAQLSNSFFGYTPENMLRLIRLSYPNSIRGDLFTEFAMETSHDSIKYVYPVYSNAQRNDFDWDNTALDGKGWNGTDWPMDDKFDDPAHKYDVMYESTESRYATELVNVPAENITVGDTVAVKFEGNALTGAYIPNASVLYVVVNGQRAAVAMQDAKGGWFGGKDILVDAAAEKYIKCNSVTQTGIDATFDIQVKTGAEGEYEAGDISDLTFAAVGRFDSERDLTGKYLGEVELQMRDYHFRPRPITLGVTWTQLTELVLDTSFGVSAEDQLMQSASEEIKKSLDFQAIKYASDVQKTYASSNFVQFDAEAGGVNNDDSYWHTAQIINQSIEHIADNMLDDFQRGGVSAIVGGTRACTYLQLNEGWSNKGKQTAIGAHKFGEINGIPVFKAPGIMPKDQLLTTWKNDQADGDVSIAIGTLLPFFSTGALQRKNFYKEAGIARYEDTQALQPKYLGRIQIKNIRD